MFKPVKPWFSRSQIATIFSSTMHWLKYQTSILVSKGEPQINYSTYIESLQHQIIKIKSTTSKR